MSAFSPAVASRVATSEPVSTGEPDERAPGLTIAAARYFAPDKAAFTHQVAIPALRRIRTDLAVDPDLLWLERHWLHGPYVGIAASHVLPETTTAEAMSQACALLGAGLHAHPSRAAEQPGRLLAGAEAAGRIEGIPGPYGPIRPDNTVDVSRPGRAHLVRSWGDPSAVVLRDRLLARAVDLLDLACARHAEQPGSRVRTALTVMALHATAYRPGATGGAMSFLSHLEDFLHRQPPGVREHFASTWAGWSGELTPAVADLLAGRAGCAVGAAAHQWSLMAVDEARTAFAAGLVPLLPPQQAAPAEDLSAFHRWVPRHFDPHAVASDFGPYRCATNVLYAVFVLADIRPVERYLAAYLLSRAVQDLTGVDWVARAETESSSPADRSPILTAPSKEMS